MTRLKPFLVVVAIGAALFSLIRTRLSESQPVDRGGWTPVEPT